VLNVEYLSYLRETVKIRKRRDVPDVAFSIELIDVDLN
jgi:hypothetical protein